MPLKSTEPSASGVVQLELLPGTATPNQQDALQPFLGPDEKAIRDALNANASLLDGVLSTPAATTQPLRARFFSLVRTGRLYGNPADPPVTLLITPDAPNGSGLWELICAGNRATTIAAPDSLVGLVDGTEIEFFIRNATFGASAITWDAVYIFHTASGPVNPTAHTSQTVGFRFRESDGTWRER